MTQDEFTTQVMHGLPQIPDQRDYDQVFDGVIRLFNDGFSVQDAIKFCIHLEEVDPNISEEKGCKVIGDLLKKYGKK